MGTVTATDPATGATDWVLWGFKVSADIRAPIKIMGGRLARCRAAHATYATQRWTCGLYPVGAAPVGLRDQARAATGTTQEVAA